MILLYEKRHVVREFGALPAAGSTASAEADAATASRKASGKTAAA
jgi:hypothetical protein